MKTRFIALSAIAAAIVALFSCNKVETDVNNPQEDAGIPFEIVANTIGTKTVNAGMSTTWASTDQINVIHVVNGETGYVSDGAFTAKEAGASVGFSGTLGGALSSESNYDWFAYYPYVSGFTKPDGTKYITIPSTQTQSAASNSEHLSGSNCPVAGSVKNQAYDVKPVIPMQNLTTVLKFSITNGTSSPISISNVSFTAPVKISGRFNLDLTGASPALTDNSSSFSSTLNITTPGTLAAGSTAYYYIAVKPFTLLGTQTLTISVTTNKGIKSKTSTATGVDFAFDAGEMTNINFNYNNESEILSTDASAVEVGFESGEGFSASTSYNNTNEKSQGTKPWGIVNGSAISTAAKITGSQSMLIRDYTANENPAYAKTYFRLSSVKEVSLKAKNNSDGYKLKLSYSTDCGLSWTDATTFNLTSEAADYKYTFPTNQTNVSFKFTMVYPATRVDKKDIIIDDVSFSKTALEPTVSVTTLGATDATSATGTTATLNGEFALLYGAVIGDLTEVGFYYKAASAGGYTKAKLGSNPAAAGAYSYGLTGLTADTEYTYYAYAVYNGGSEVIGTNQSFTTVSALMVLDLTTKAISGAGYSAETTWGDWKIKNGANNNKGWAYFKMGGKKETIEADGGNPCYIYSTVASTAAAASVVVHIPSGSLSKSGMAVNSWGVEVYSDSALNTKIDTAAGGGTISNSEGTFTFTPSAGYGSASWPTGSYFKVVWDLANTSSTNGVVCVDKVIVFKP